MKCSTGHLRRNQRIRSPLSSIEKLPEACATDFAWMRDAVQARRMSQAAILAAFNARIAVHGAGPISKGAFSRYLERSRADFQAAASLSLNPNSQVRAEIGVFHALNFPKRGEIEAEKRALRAAMAAMTAGQMACIPSPGLGEAFAALDAIYDNAKAEQILDQSVEKVCRDGLATLHVVDADKRYLHGVIAQRSIKRIRRDNVGKHELLQGVKSILEFVELVLCDLGHDGEAPAAGDGEQPTMTSAAPHRFDGAAK